MHVVRVPKFGPPEVLEYLEQPDLEPGAGEVRAAVRAVGINFADITARMGLYPDSGKPPFVTGYEFSGVVDRIGEGVEGVQEGDAIIGMKNFGCYADSVVTSAELTFPLPAGIDPVRGAAFPVTYITAWHAMVYLGNLHAGERVLIQNAGGGVGTAAIQIARHRGAEILGTASAAKHDFIRELGVDHAIDYRQSDWADEVREITGGKGVEMILNPLGGRSLKTDFGLLAHTGRLIAYGVSSGARGMSRNLPKAAWNIFRTPKFSPLQMMMRNKGVFGVHIGHLWHRQDVLAGEFAEMLELLQEGILDPIIDTTFPLEEAAKAHRYIQDRKNRGKVVLTV
jgi:NADPH:quinone reductase-like Zn-dependent oxidoreductase